MSEQVLGATALPEDIIDVSDMDTSFKEALDRLDNIALNADYNIDEDENDDGTPETGSVGDCSLKSDEISDKKSDSSSVKSNDKTKNSDRKENGRKVPKEPKKSVFSKLKKLTKFDKPKQPDPNTVVPKLDSTKLSEIKIDRLPQLFVCKYLGKRDVKGVYGLHYVRKPVDELVGKVKKTLLANETVELPLVYVVISNKGIDVKEHQGNRIKDGVTFGNVPIDFISYGVQDMKFWKVFTFIVVSELSSRTKKMECHGYLCDSPTNARKMALSLGASFQLYKTKLAKEGKAHNFQVELRPPDELAVEYTKEDEEEEC
ncbi:uncharacterized protein LOC143064379 [Mytilus galloprovincialis]|uniref:PID domain-containing protein n=1 Tax=Mytilus galloprovincialis TaxID=29158 RepID=A0A8B6EH83_MYTGA|nr:Hypothetical predicted protein [Mytilus galloprovincialis]